MKGMALGGQPANLREAVEHYINSFSLENGSDTPDFILAEYLEGCLQNFDRALQAREKWYGRPILPKQSERIVGARPELGAGYGSKAPVTDAPKGLDLNLPEGAQA